MQTNKAFPPFQNINVRHVFDAYPEDIQDKCLFLRQLIFDVASQDSRIGPIDETLRWGEPTYIPSKTKSGAMVRLHHYASKPFDFALYFLCQTDLVHRFREMYPNTFRFSGNRSLQFMFEDELPVHDIKECVRMSFLYYLNREL